MRVNSFARTVAFAALSAAFSIPFLWMTGSWLGEKSALAALLVGITALYTAGIAPRRGARLPLGALALGLGGGAAWLAPSPSVLVVTLAGILAVLRSTILYRARPARALVLEGVLLTGGLLLAQFLAGPRAFEVGLAIWGFFLVQSLFFLVRGIGIRPSSAEGIDPFDRAYARARALLEDE